MSDPLSQWLESQRGLIGEERDAMGCPVCGVPSVIRFGRHTNTFQVYHGESAKACAFNSTFAMISGGESPKEAAALFAEAKAKYLSTT